MVRLQSSRSKYDLTLKSNTDYPIYLMFDRQRFKTGRFKLEARYIQTEPSGGNDISIQEWTWANGPGGAGTTIETPSSYTAGSSEYGEFVWLRRLGIAQAAGALTEVSLPSGGAALTSGKFFCGVVHGGNNDLWVTTEHRYVERFRFLAGVLTVLEFDGGSGARITGAAVFDGSGDSRIYFGDPNNGIWEYDGSNFTEGEAGTERAFLEVPYWNVGGQLATGGAAAAGGTGAHRLVGVNASATGFYHVAGDPQVAANWSSLQKVGIGQQVFPIKQTVASNRTVWFSTGMGVMGCDEIGHTPNLLKTVELTSSQFNGLAVAYWNGLIWYAHEQGLMVFSPDGTRIDMGTFLQFGAASGTMPIFGRPRTISPSPQGLYVGYYNGTDSYVGCLVIDPDGRYRWSMAEAVIRGQQVTFVQQTSDANGVLRLWIGTIGSNGALHMYYQELPQSGDPETDFLHGDGTFTPAPDWNLTLSRSNGGRTVPRTFAAWVGSTGCVRS